MSSIISRLTSSRSSRASASSTTMSSSALAGASTTTVPSVLGTSVTSLPLSTNTNTSSTTSEGVPMHEPVDEDVLQEVAGMMVIDSRGNHIPFGRIYEYQRTVVVFIRHFFCGMCASYTSALAKVPTDALDAAGTKIVLVGCGAWDMIPTYQDTTKFKGLVYSDPTLKLHEKLGLVSDLIVPPKNERSIRSYVPRRYGKAVRKGIVEGLKQPINAFTGRYGPIPQLGGDFILGPGNVCSYAHRMRNTMDHLEVYDLMALADVHLPPTPPKSSKQAKQKRSQHSISYSYARPLMGDVDEDCGCGVTSEPQEKSSRHGLWSSSASTKSTGAAPNANANGTGNGGGGVVVGRRRSPSHAANNPPSTTTTPLEERWSGRPVSMILRGTGSESDLMYRAHHGLTPSHAGFGVSGQSFGVGGPGVVSGGYGYFDAGDEEDAAGGGDAGVWYSRAGAVEGDEKEGSYWKAGTGDAGENASAGGKGKKRRGPNPFTAVSIPVQSVPLGGGLQSPTRPGTSSGVLGVTEKGGEAGARPNTSLGMSSRRVGENRSLSTTGSSASSGIPVLKKSGGGPNKLKRASTTTAVPTLITTGSGHATSALTIPSGPHLSASGPSSASSTTSPPFSPTTPTSASSPPTSPIRSPPSKKRSLTSAAQPAASGGGNPPLSPSHSFALSFAPGNSHPPSPIPLPSGPGSSPPVGSPPRGNVNAKIIDPAELLSADLESWGAKSSTSVSRPTTAGGTGSVRSVVMEDGGNLGASVGRRMRQMSLSETRDERR